MTSLRFWKLQSVGNDFVLVHEEDVARAADDLDAAYAGLAVEASRRRFGVGSDGLLAAAPLAGGRLKLRMFNPDGTEDFCGNGLRCAAVHAHTQGWIGEAFEIEHHGSVVPGTIEPDGSVSLRLGAASFDPAAVPLAPGVGELFAATIEVEGEALAVSSLTTGSTHTVILVDELPGDERFVGVSSALEVDPRYPERTSVVWAHEQAPGELALRIWERGAGETLGCGTGSAAAAAVWARTHGAAGDVRVLNPGGLIVATLGRWDGPVTLRSRAQAVFSGRLAWTEGRSPRGGTASSTPAFRR